MYLIIASKLQKLVFQFFLVLNDLIKFDLQDICLQIMYLCFICSVQFDFIFQISVIINNLLTKYYYQMLSTYSIILACLDCSILTSSSIFFISESKLYISEPSELLLSVLLFISNDRKSFSA